MLPEKELLPGRKGCRRTVRQRALEEGQDGDEAGVGGRAKSPTRAARGSCRGQLAAVTCVAVNRGDPAPKPEDGHGDGEDGGPEGVGGVAG